MIAEWEVRQLIVVQGSRISASVYLFVCVQCSGMREVPHSVRGCTHEENVILIISGHELLFISLDFMVEKINDYWFQGCMMNILTRL